MQIKDLHVRQMHASEREAPAGALPTGAQCLETFRRLEDSSRRETRREVMRRRDVQSNALSPHLRVLLPETSACAPAIASPQRARRLQSVHNVLMHNNLPGEAPILSPVFSSAANRS